MISSQSKSRNMFDGLQTRSNDRCTGMRSMPTTPPQRSKSRTIDHFQVRNRESVVANAREVNGQLVYKVKVRDTGAGKSITIPVDICRYLGIEIGDTMVVVPLDDGMVVSKVEHEEKRGS